MRARMSHGLVAMPMAVRLHGCCVVGVVVVPVVVGMGVLMFNGQMFVRMRMKLHQVKR